MNKQDFWNLISPMEYPILFEHSSNDDSQFGICVKPYAILYIRDGENFSECKEIATIRALSREIEVLYTKYYTRERKAKRIYERWLHEFCGDHCKSELSMRFPN